MAVLTIAALSTPFTISAAALCACKEAAQLFLQTEQSPAALPLKGLQYESLDCAYEAAEDFDSLNNAIATRLAAALMKGDVVYAVPGRGPGAALLRALGAALDGTGHTVAHLPGLGYADAVPWPLGVRGDAFVAAAASALPLCLDPYTSLAVEELDTRLRAGAVKLRLSEYWPDAWSVYFAVMGADGRYAVREIPLYALDQQAGYHAATAVLVPAATFDALERHGYEGLQGVTARLRAPGGCPWDREQTHESLKRNLIEECYEVIDAIDQGDDAALCEELGDVLLQVALHAQIAEEQARFTHRDVTTGIVDKLVYRHPHVFGNGDAKTADAVLVKWEQLKKAEKHFATQGEVLLAVPRSLPALMRSYKLQKKAAQVGFDWDSARDALPKLREEVEELTAAIEGSGDIGEEMGDLLFAAVNVARLLKLEPESILTSAADKFLKRFIKMENIAISEGLRLEDMALSEQNKLWDMVKTAENRAK